MEIISDSLTSYAISAPGGANVMPTLGVSRYDCARAPADATSESKLTIAPMTRRVSLNAEAEMEVTKFALQRKARSRRITRASVSDACRRADLGRIGSGTLTSASSQESAAKTRVVAQPNSCVRVRAEFRMSGLRFASGRHPLSDS